MNIIKKKFDEFRFELYLNKAEDSLIECKRAFKKAERVCRENRAYTQVSKSECNYSYIDTISILIEDIQSRFCRIVGCFSSHKKTRDKEKLYLEYFNEP